MYSERSETELARPPAEDGESLLTIRKLNFAFGQAELRKQILFEIDFDLRPGEIVILEGPSGSGKTTLLTLISGLRRFSEGSIRVFGRELQAASQEQLLELRRQIGFIFQLHNLLPFLTARQNVELALKHSPGLPVEEVGRRSQSALELLGLGPQAGSFPSALSGGQKQRVAIARALVAEPKLVLADEPTASLDKQAGRQVVDQLQQMARSRGIPILLVTHDNRILDIADRIVRMEDGRILS